MTSWLSSSSTLAGLGGVVWAGAASGPDATRANTNRRARVFMAAGDRLRPGSGQGESHHEASLAVRRGRVVSDGLRLFLPELHQGRGAGAPPARRGGARAAAARSGDLPPRSTGAARRGRACRVRAGAAVISEMIR